MNHEATTEILNRVLAVINRSLPMYLAEAAPWTHPGDEQAAQSLERIVADQRRDVSRLAELIIDRAGRIDPGHWPMEYTDLNFLSLDFLLRELVSHQQDDIGRIANCVALLASDHDAHELAQEILGSEKAHLESLQELTRQTVSQ